MFCNLLQNTKRMPGTCRNPFLLIIVLCFFQIAHSQTLYVLGTAQDAGYPQPDCQKECCRGLWPDKGAKVACLGIVDEASNQSWMIDATPDFPAQLYTLEQKAPLAGILLTHAHIGHYTGLMYLGREAMGADQVPVYAMSRMRRFLRQNGPWSQLVALKNIQLQQLHADSATILSERIKITPLLVPHRDEFSETVGFLIEGASKSALYVPDIDKWHLWDRDILALIRQVDYALLDATFFENGEIPTRDMSEIPHPFVEESMQLFSQLDAVNRNKVYFIHFNHTNPLLKAGSSAKQKVESSGFHIATEGMQLSLF